MKACRAKFVGFVDNAFAAHYGLLLADGQTIVCACCGDMFNLTEDATIVQSCEWYGNDLKEFIKEAVLGL